MQVPLGASGQVMNQNATPSPDPHDLADTLAPALIQACGGGLHSIRWFRTDWQRGGAATAYARCDMPGGEREVVIKFPVGPREYRVATALAEADAPTPRLAFHGTLLGSAEMAWLVMERLPGEPLSVQTHHEVIAQVAEAAAQFHCCMQQRVPMAPVREVGDWTDLVEKSRAITRAGASAEAQRWSNALRHAHKVLPALLERWHRRAINTWCHGDLHPGNAMHRPEGSAWGPARCVLLDFAEAHPGHWVEDAVYLERVHWSRPEALAGAKPVSLLAKARRAVGLDTSDDYAGLANIRRVLIAATAPVLQRHEAGPRSLHAALETLERLLPVVAR